MEEKPLVSIAIPAYNKPEYTRKTLKSIVEQTYRPIEVVLSDDASPEPLEPLVNEIARYQDDNLAVKLFPSLSFVKNKKRAPIVGNRIKDERIGKFII